MKEKIAQLGSWLKTKITNYDLYPKVVNFTCDGDDKFQTFFGGIVSVMIRIFIFVIAILLTVMIINKEKSTFSVTSIQKDLTNDKEEHYFAQNDIFYWIKLNWTLFVIFYLSKIEIKQYFCFITFKIYTYLLLYYLFFNFIFSLISFINSYIFKHIAFI